MFNSLEYSYATEPLRNDPTEYYSLDPSRFEDTNGIYRNSQMMASESVMNRWQENQNTTQNFHFEPDVKFVGPAGSNQGRNSLAQNKVPSKPAEWVLLHVYSELMLTWIMRQGYDTWTAASHEKQI